MIESRIDWLKERQKGIGGSDVAAILGVSAYRTPLDVFMDKTSEITEDKSPSEAAYWGTTLEDIVAQEFSRRTGLKVQRVNQSLASNLDRYIDVTGSDVYQWARANIDRAVINPKIAKTVRLSKPATPCSGRGLMLTTDAILECKTANARMSPEWGGIPRSRNTGWRCDVRARNSDLLRNADPVVHGYHRRQHLLRRSSDRRPGLPYVRSQAQ